MRIFFRFLAIIITLIFFSEILARIALTSPANNIPDNELGWTYKPNSTIFFTREGNATNKINSMGFNDDELDINNDKIHILVLGDSITEALQVPKSSNFTSVAETMAPCFSVYNAGRSGLSPVHYPIVLSRVADTISPALTVIVVTSGDMVEIMNGKYEIIRDDSNKIIELYLNEKPLSKFRIKIDPIISRSALATYLAQRVKALLINKHQENTAVNSNQTATAYTDKLRIHEILVYLMEYMKSQTPVAILYIPNLEYDINRTATVDKKSSEFEHVLQDVANVTDIPILSTEPYMVDSYRKHGQPGAGFSNKNILHGHLNKLGHQAVAVAMLELTKSVGLPCPLMTNNEIKTY